MSAHTILLAINPMLACTTYYQLDASRLFMGTLHTIESTYREWSTFNAVYIVSSAIKKFVYYNMCDIRT